MDLCFVENVNQIFKNPKTNTFFARVGFGFDLTIRDLSKTLPLQKPYRFAERLIRLEHGRPSTFGPNVGREGVRHGHRLHKNWGHRLHLYFLVLCFRGLIMSRVLERRGAM